MWVKGSMGRVVPAGACSYVCRLGGCRVAGRPWGCRACAARSTSRYSSRPTIIRHSFARTWHDTRSPRCFRGAARPATRTRGRSGRSPAPRSAGAAGRGPCPRTATWPMRHRRRAGSADRTWPPGSHRVTRSDVGPGHPRPGAHAQTPQRALVDALARREDAEVADGPVPGRICDAHSTHAHSVSQNLHGTANTHRRGPTREPPRDRHARRAATASRPTAARGRTSAPCIAAPCKG